MFIFTSRLHAQQIITTIAGTGLHSGAIGVYGGPYPPIGDGGPATEALLYPCYLIVDDSGNIYISELNYPVVRKINSAGIISTFAGRYTGPDFDFIMSDSTLCRPAGLAKDHHGNLYIADAGNDCVRKISASGAFSTFAGTATYFGYSGDGGPATMALLSYPTSVAIDDKGNVYIADRDNFRIRKVDTAGIITTIAGTGTAGHSGDGGPALDAKLLPEFVALDAKNNIYVSDETEYIRKIDTSGIITRIAGNGVLDGYSGDGGPADSAAIDCLSMVIDSAGNVYDADATNNRLRKIDTAGIITTVAGTGACCYGGDGGPADSAELDAEFGVALDRTGHIYLADCGNGRIRKITDTFQYANITCNAGVIICSGTVVTFTAHAADTTPYHYQWRVNGSAAGGDSATFSTSSLSNGDSVVCYYSDTSGLAIDTSNAITMAVLPAVAVSVRVTSGAPAVLCGGAYVTYTATGTNGGSMFSYRWQVNGIASGTDSLFTYPPSDGDTVVCLFTSDTACASPDTAASVPLVMSVVPLPDAGYISGGYYVCTGDSITLTDADTGGVWSSSNSHAALSTVSAGAEVTGITAGTDDISYVVTNSCGTAVATLPLSVRPLPYAAAISGAGTVCAAATVTLTDTASGGLWAVTGPSAGVTTAGGVVTGVSAGADTVLYLVTNICGTDTARKAITVLPLPVAGTIAGPAYVCAGSSITLSDTAAGGAWSVTNAAASLSGTALTGISPGTDTVSYLVTNACGTRAATKIIAVDPLPYSGVISGDTIVCVGATIVLTDTASGGAWHCSNGDAAIVSGTVTGMSAGTDTVLYLVSNVCGTDTAEKRIIVLPLPVAGSISGMPSVCVGSNDTLTATIPGGVWSRSNATAAIAPATGGSGKVTGTGAGTDTISYSVTNSCGTAVAFYPVAILPLPDAGTVSGVNLLCAGAVAAFTDSAPGGEWSSSNTAMAGINSEGMVSGVSAGTDTIVYTVTNSCGTARATDGLTITPSPTFVHITTHPDGMLCAGTMYQNVGTGLPQPAGINYQWLGDMATIYATGSGRQYCLVDFETQGTAFVILSAQDITNGCTTNDSFAANVGAGPDAQPEVAFVGGNDLVCLDNTADSYQWGYDDKNTLDSALLPGETNQDYFNAAPDFANKYYWVMTTHGDCLQKSYYILPTSVSSLNTGNPEIRLFPNPATGSVNIGITGTDKSAAIGVKLLGTDGSARYTGSITEGAGSIDVSRLAPGVYFAVFSRNGEVIGSKTFVKN